MKYIAILALAAATAASTGTAFAGPPTEPVQINSQREYVLHQIQCAGLLFDSAEHARICGTMDGDNVDLGSGPSAPVRRYIEVLTEVPSAL